MNAGTLTAFLKLDRSDYSSGIDTSKKQAQELEKSLSQMEKSSSSSFSKLGSSVVSAAKDMATAGSDGFTKLRGSINELDTSSKVTLETFKSFGVGVVAAAGVAAVGFAALMGQSIQAASDLNEVQSKFDVVFKGQTDTASAWADTLVSSYAMSTTEAKRYLSSVQDLLVPMGMASTEAGVMSNSIVQLSADLGSFNNLPTAQVMDDISSALVGEYDTMKKYGVVLDAAVVEQRALTLGLAETKDELTAADKAQAAYTLMVDASSAAIGDMARTSDGYANQLKLFTATTEDLVASLSSKLLPVAADVLSQMNTGMLNSKGGVDQLAESLATTLLTAFKYTLEVMRFFENGWLGIKLVGTASIQAIATALEDLFGGMRNMMLPLDAIFEGLVKIGAIDVNPFDKIEGSLVTFSASSRDVTNDVLDDIQKTNAGYDSIGKSIDGYIKKVTEGGAQGAAASYGMGSASASLSAALNGTATSFDKTTDAADKNKKKIKDTGMEYASLSQEFFLLKEAGANLGSQLQMLEKMKGIDILSDSAKEATKNSEDLVSETNKLIKENEKLKKTAEELKEEYRTLRLETGDFFDGFNVGIEDAIDSISTMGELGKETFDTLYSSWKDGFYAVITADWEGLSSVWDSLLSSLLRTFSDFVAGLLLKWAAAEFLNITIGVNGSTLTSGSSSSIISGIASMFSSSSDASTQSWSGSENASTYASGAASLGQQGSGMLATGAGYLGMGVGAYGVYSGASNIAEGNYGTGALQVGLGATSMYKGAVAADLLTEGTATEMAKAAWTGVKSYWSGSAGTAASAEIGAQVGTQIAEGIHTAYTAGQGATSYTSFQTAASGSGGAAGGSVMAGLGAVGAFMALVYSLNNVGGETPTISPSESMNAMGMTPEDLSAITNSWSIVTDTVLDLDDSLSQFGVGMQTIGEVTYNANESMLYYTTGMGVMASSFDEATQTWSDAAVGMHLDAMQLGASATAASSQTIEAAASIISSYTGTSTTMFDAATVANHAANAYQDLATSESGSTTYAIELQWALQDMGLTAGQAASAADELIAQMEAETEAQNGVASSADTATGSLMGFGSIITETATATADSMSTLVSSLGGFTSSVSDTADSLRKAVGSWDEAVSSEGSRSATSEHAAGGIFTQPARIGRHIFGEAGMEALLPLPDGPNTLSNMSKAITRLEQNQGSSYFGPSTIQVNLIAEGKTLAKVVMPFVDQQVTAQSRRGVLSERTNF